MNEIFGWIYVIGCIVTFIVSLILMARDKGGSYDDEVGVAIAIIVFLWPVVAVCIIGVIFIRLGRFIFGAKKRRRQAEEDARLDAELDQQLLEIRRERNADKRRISWLNIAMGVLLRRQLVRK